MFEKRNSEKLANARVIRRPNGAKLSKRHVGYIRDMAQYINDGVKLVSYHKRRRRAIWSDGSITRVLGKKNWEKVVSNDD